MNNLYNSFSIPYNFKYDIDKFDNFLKNKKEFIYDIYIGLNLKPFFQDAMGLKIDKQDVDDFVFISKKYDIPISLTFNNICVSSSYDNYKLFVKNLKEFLKKYKNVKWRFTIPFTIWLKFGFKKEIEDFLGREILVKNTILWNLNDPAKIAKQFEEGFDYINLDRNLIRNKDLLIEIKKMKEIMEQKLNKKLYISLLANENCEGNCPVQMDHFNYNITNNKLKFFKDLNNKINSCYYKDQTNPRLYLLKTANIIPELSEFLYYKNFVDVFKMHGRESLFTFEQTLDIINNLDNKNMTKNYIEIFESEDDYNEFKNVIHNCKFQCYKCKYCDEKIELFEKRKEKIIQEFKLF